MAYLSERDGPDYQIIRLTAEQKANPYEVMESFFIDHCPGEIRAFLADVSEACLTTNRPPFSHAEKRDDLFVYLPKIESVLEASWLIALKRER